MIAKSLQDELGVLTLVDSLAIGGTESVAVGIANQLAADGVRSFLCTTRAEGPLAGNISAAVGQLHLHRSRTVEWKAIRKLTNFIREHRISILHAHSSSVLTANLVSRFSPYPRIVWHDHFGPNDREQRSVWMYRGLTRRVGGIVAVSEPLADWSRQRLKFPSDRVWCLPNFVNISSSQLDSVELPGRKGSRVVCVANVRPVKDHLNLIQAWRLVVAQHPQAHLLLVGGLSDGEYVAQVRESVDRQGLRKHVTLLGAREDVPDLLRSCDVAVLSSMSEGLPVSLLEYGAARLPVVVTDVGQCADVVEHGKSGLVVPPGNPEQHAQAMINLLDNERQRESLSARFHSRVKQRYSASAVMKELSRIYSTVLEI